VVEAPVVAAVVAAVVAVLLPGVGVT